MKKLLLSPLWAGVSLVVVAGTPDAVLKVRPSDGAGPLIVGEPAKVGVSVRARLPIGKLLWILFVEKEERASGEIEWLADSVPRREFSVDISVQHAEFSAARIGDLVTRGLQDATSPPVVRDVRFDLVIRQDDRSGKIVAKATTIAKTMCAASDKHLACLPSPTNDLIRSRPGSP